MAKEITAAEKLDFSKALETKYAMAQQAFRDRTGTRAPNDIYLRREELSTIIPTNSAASVIGWVKDFPGIKEWAKGTQRDLHTLDKEGLVVVPRRFQNGFTVEVDTLADHDYALYGPAVETLAVDAEEFDMDLAIEVLLGNPDWLDYNPFLCSGRVMGADPASGAPITITNAVTTALSAAALEAALAEIQKWRLGAGENVRVRPETLLVGPSLEALGRKLLLASLVDSGNSNTLLNRLTLRVDRNITDNRWFVIGKRGALYPVCILKRLEAKFSRLGEGSDREFLNDELAFGVKIRAEAFGALPYAIYAGGMASVPAWVDYSLTEPEPEPGGSGG